MDAVILAAGQGSRLKPITNHLPKPMIRFWQKPFLEYTIDNLSEHGQIERIFIVVNYRKDQLIDHFGRTWRGKELFYLEQKDPKGGTADALLTAKNKIRKDFIVILGDVYLSKRHISQLTDSVGTLLSLTKITDPQNHKVVKFNSQKQVIGFGEDSNWADLGFWRLPSRIFEYIEESRKSLNQLMSLRCWQ